MGRAGTTLENTLLGSFAAAGACCVMIPVDTVKTRIVTQPPGVRNYDGMIDCLMQVLYCILSRDQLQPSPNLNLKPSM